MEMFRKFIESLDWPGGSVINLFSLTFLAMLWHAYLTGKTIDPSFLTLYGIVLGPYATVRMVKTVWGKGHVVETKE
jgi:ABC-type Co2+ transport system permease subunit